MTGDTNQGGDRNEREPESPRFTPMQVAGKVVGLALIVLVLLIVISVVGRM